VEGYTAETYGESIADVYDEWLDPAQGNTMAALLADLAGDGPALELGIGTGRVALPLAARGVPVYGVDASPRMVEQLRAKPGGNNIQVTIADLTDVPVEVPGGFSLVYVVASTLYCLPSQGDQVRCLCSAAARLRPGGHLVVEGFVPDPGRFDRDQRVEARRVAVNQVRIDVAQHDRLTQTVVSQQVILTTGGIRLQPTRVRYIWPAELDLMARLAGLILVGRYGDWQRGPFTSASPSHVSIYGLEQPTGDSQVAGTP
jgi:SAM-dependent methyltransferase